MHRKLQAKTFDEGAVVERCFACGGDYQHSHHRYGQFIARYQIGVCSGCYRPNSDGWGPMAEAKIPGHLEAKGIAVPSGNEKGWLPRE
jgi:hypothetical protein